MVNLKAIKLLAVPIRKFHNRLMVTPHIKEIQNSSADTRLWRWKTKHGKSQR